MKEKFQQADALQELEEFLKSLVRDNGITRDAANTLLPILTDMLLTKSDTEKYTKLAEQINSHEKDSLCAQDKIEVMMSKLSILKTQVMTSEANQAIKEGQDLIQRMQLELNPALNRQSI